MSVILDILDFNFYKRAGYKTHDYQKADKTLDFYWLSISFAYAVLSLPYKSVLIFLFTIRFVGQYLFYKTHDQRYLILFANYYEYVFIYVLFTSFYPQLSQLIPVTGGLVLLFVVAKMFQEALIHYFMVKYHSILPDWIKLPL